MLTLDFVIKLAHDHVRPLLAVKAYAAFLSSFTSTASMASEGDDRPEDYYLHIYNFVLHCNAFAIQEYLADPEATSSARDYVCCAVDLLRRTHGFEFFDDSELDGGLDTIEALVAAYRVSVLESESVNVHSEVLFLLSLTLANWGCLELSARRVSRGFALLKMSEVTASAVPSAFCNYMVDTVGVINESVREIILCNFPEALELARSCIAPLIEARGSLLEGRSSVNPSIQEELRDIAMLRGASYHACGVAGEQDHYDDTIKSYEDAVQQFTSASAGAQPGSERLLKVICNHQAQFTQFIEESKQKAAAIAQPVEELALRDPRKVGSHGGKKSNVAKGIRGMLLQPERPPVVTTPPITATLRCNIRKHGLDLVIGATFSLSDAFDVVNTEGVPFQSPLLTSAAVRGAEGYGQLRVAAFMVCAETPMWLALEVDRANHGARPRNSVWTLRQGLPWYLMPADEAGDAKEKRVAAPSGSARRRPPVLRAFMPAPLSKSSLEDAQKSVNTVVKLLSQRLNVLLKAEKAFHDLWTMTERIKAALIACTVPQDMLKLKASMKAKKRLETQQADRSVRILVRFFRRVVVEKPRLHGFVSLEERRRQRDTHAAIVLQKNVRRWLARQERRRLQEKRRCEIRHITLVQALFRGQQARRYCTNLIDARRRDAFIGKLHLTRQHAAIQIQRVYRGHVERRLTLCRRGRLVEAMLHHLHDARHYYATQIQRCVRGMLVRRQYGKAISARRCYGRTTYRATREIESCVTIQRMYRGWRARCENSSIIRQRCMAVSAAKAAEEAAGVALVQREVEGIHNSAAVKIQTIFRGCLAMALVKERMARRAGAAHCRDGEVYRPFNVDEWEY